MSSSGTPMDRNVNVSVSVFSSTAAALASLGRRIANRTASKPLRLNVRRVSAFTTDERGMGPKMGLVVAAQRDFRESESGLLLLRIPESGRFGLSNLLEGMYHLRLPRLRVWIR